MGVYWYNTYLIHVRRVSLECPQVSVGILATQGHMSVGAQVVFTTDTCPQCVCRCPQVQVGIFATYRHISVGVCRLITCRHMSVGVLSPTDTCLQCPQYFFSPKDTYGHPYIQNCWLLDVLTWCTLINNSNQHVF